MAGLLASIGFAGAGAVLGIQAAAGDALELSKEGIKLGSEIMVAAKGGLSGEITRQVGDRWRFGSQFTARSVASYRRWRHDGFPPRHDRRIMLG